MQTMGEAVGVPRQTWNNWEHSKHLIPVKRAILLFQAFGVSLYWLYLGRVNPPSI